MAGLVAATLLESKTRHRTALPDALVIQCCVSAILFTGLAVVSGQFAPPAHTSGFWIAVAWFVVLSTLGGYGFYWLNLARTGPTRVSSLVYLTPPTTMLWAFVMFGQTITPTAILGLLVCLTAVVLVHRGDGHRPRPMARLASPDTHPTTAAGGPDETQPRGQVVTPCRGTPEA
jgi:drug/metabolite transporter (DMT)-like permease